PRTPRAPPAAPAPPPPTGVYHQLRTVIPIGDRHGAVAAAATTTTAAAEIAQPTTASTISAGTALRDVLCGVESTPPVGGAPVPSSRSGTYGQILCRRD